MEGGGFLKMQRSRPSESEISGWAPGIYIFKMFHIDSDAFAVRNYKAGRIVSVLVLPEIGFLCHGVRLGVMEFEDLDPVWDGTIY